MRLSELESWMTITQAAERIGVHRQRVAVLAQDSRIRGVLAGRNHEGRGVWILDPESVEAFRVEHEQRTARGEES